VQSKLFDLSGQTALVTGAACGLGLAFTEILSEHGARVAMLDIDAAALQRSAKRLRDQGRAVDEHVVDVGDRTRLRGVTDAVAKQGRLDIVFANAGISARPGYKTAVGQIEAVQDEAWQRVLDINLTSVFVTLQAAAAPMKRQRSGRIIVVSSIAGIKSEAPVGYAYAATKAAINNLVRQAAMELAPFNIMVNAIAPGPFRTNIAGGRINQPEVEAMFAAMVPLGRIGEPDEIKGLALLLASPAASFLTGTVIPIDGGSTAA